MKKITLLFSLICLLFSSALQAASRTEIILDVSGSMNKLLGSETRIQAARKAVAAALAGIPDGSIVAFRMYGHRVPQTDKAGSCKDSQLVIPFGPVNKAQIQAMVDAAQPLGQTPIAYSLEQAATDFGAGADEQAAIILVSDGEESCGGDPVAVAKALIAKGFKVKIHTIGIDVDAAAKAQLEGISGATGGQYKDARDVASLTSSLQQLTQDALLVKKEQAVYGDAVRGGDSFETAVPLTPGKLLRLDHHQRQNQFDYFSVDVKPGQKLVASVETGENGVAIQGGQATVNTSPYAGIAVNGPQRTELKRVDVIGERNGKRSIEVPIATGQDGKYYILVGSVYDSQNKDNRFKVELISQTDANTDKDAGDTDATAIEIQQGTYDKNYLNGNDAQDNFKINLAAGTYELKVRPLAQTAVITVNLVDADGVELASGRSPNEGAAATVPFFVNKPGYVFMRIKEPYSPGGGDIPYVLSIGPGNGAMPPGYQAGTVPPVVTTNVPTGNSDAVPPPASGTVSSSVQTKTLSSATGGESLITPAFASMSFVTKAKLLIIYVIGPAFGVFLIGLLWGYIWGRRSGKRKTLAKIAKAQPKIATPPPPAAPKL